MSLAAILKTGSSPYALFFLDEAYYGMKITDLSTDEYNKDYTTYWKEFDFSLLPWNVLPIDYDVLSTEGIHDITLTVTDDNGNSADYIFKVNVLYEIDPSLREGNGLLSGYEDEWDYILAAVDQWREANNWIFGESEIPAGLYNHDYIGMEQDEIVPDMGDTAGTIRFTGDDGLFITPGETLPLYAIDIRYDSVYQFLLQTGMEDVTILEYIDGSMEKTDDTVSFKYHIDQHPEYDLYMEYSISGAYWNFALIVR